MFIILAQMGCVSMVNCNPRATASVILGNVQPWKIGTAFRTEVGTAIKNVGYWVRSGLRF